MIQTWELAGQNARSRPSLTIARYRRRIVTRAQPQGAPLFRSGDFAFMQQVNSEAQHARARRLAKSRTPQLVRQYDSARQARSVPQIVFDDTQLCDHAVRHLSGGGIYAVRIGKLKNTGTNGCGGTRIHFGHDRIADVRRQNELPCFHYGIRCNKTQAADESQANTSNWYRRCDGIEGGVLCRTVKHESTNWLWTRGCYDTGITTQ
jgi:hypothetical protein